MVVSTSFLNVKIFSPENSKSLQSNLRKNPRKKIQKRNGYQLISNQSSNEFAVENYFEFDGKYWTRESFLQMATYALVVYQSLDNSMISKEARKQVVKLLKLGINDEQYMYATLVGLKRYHLNKEKTCIIFE
ncbi:hypothetical protein H012_gp307 [Acanthamoeba polyphaga moumouvirus]|uniref:Uncharacterized protein n=1 Tax=Acanthamoeba polyphaga moumouvirus TaxID=1269028 RepID=L7RCV7_9VIRU|nr:hypothetical protein H012_gp307 [Acanthamoeba polyphaga moumouvirus]AGC02147.1 hypothetical protein Moumou_00623 [Acanthamoeba polyphaga moumouvirus]